MKPDIHEDSFSSRPQNMQDPVSDMPPPPRFVQYHNGTHQVDPTWFEAQLLPNKDPVLDRWLRGEIEVLKAFHDGVKDAEETAMAITRPVSLSPVPTIRSYPDEIVALMGLWYLLISALWEWHATRTPHLFALLEAIAKVPDLIHNGEATDHLGVKQLTWSDYPYFGAAWHNMDGLEYPGQICRWYPEAASLEAMRLVYLRHKDIEAQCLARSALAWTRVRMRYVTDTLEKEIDESDLKIASNEPEACSQIKLEFNLPGVALWFCHNGREIHRRVTQDNGSNWIDGSSAGETRGSERGSKRLSFWKRRLAELATHHDNENVRSAARASLGYMEEADTASVMQSLHC